MVVIDVVHIDRKPLDRQRNALVEGRVIDRRSRKAVSAVQQVNQPFHLLQVIHPGGVWLGLRLTPEHWSVKEDIGDVP